MTGSMVEEVVGRLTAEQALAGRRYLSEVAGDDGVVTLALRAPWPSPSPALRSGLLLSTLLALDEALGDATIHRLDLRLDGNGLAGTALEDIFATQWFAQAREVHLPKATAKALAALAAGGASVTRLDLSHIKVGKGVGKLSGLMNLTSLQLDHAGMDAAATKLLAAANLPALRRLELRGWGGHITTAKYNQQNVDGHFKFPVVDEALARALLETELATRLTHLTISDTKLSAPACRVFAGADLRSLASLCLNEAIIEDVDALLSNPLPALRELERASGFPGAALGRAAFVPQLRALKLGSTEMKERDVCAVLRRAVALETLDLRAMGLGHETAKVIVEVTPPLTELRLAWNALGDQSAALLGGAAFVPNLTVFSVSETAVGGIGVAALAGAALDAAKIVGFGGLALTNAEATPLLEAAWISGCTGITLSKNQLDDAVVPRLTRFPTTTWLFVDGNRFSPDGIAALQAHFGPRLNAGRQHDGRKLEARPLFDEVFGLKFRAGKRPPARGESATSKELPAWIVKTGLRVVGTSSRAHVAVQPDPDGGADRLVLLLDWEKQTVPLGVPASALAADGKVQCNQCTGDGPLVLAIPGDGVYAVDIFKGGVTRLGEVGASVEAVTDVPSSDGMKTTGTAVLHGTAGVQTLELYVPAHAEVRRPAVTGLAGFRSCGAGTYGEIVIVGPGSDEEGPIRFFAVSAEHGLAPMGGFERGFSQVSGGVAQGDQMWTPDGVTTAARRAFQRRDEAASS